MGMALFSIGSHARRPDLAAATHVNYPLRPVPVARCSSRAASCPVVRLEPRGAVKTVCIPQRGGSKTPQRQAYEKSAPFKQGQRFRAGIEGRISVLLRGRGMKRCRSEGAERFALFVGAAALANNLMIVAALLTKRSSRRRKAAQ
jgi:hypothetical protein